MNALSMSMIEATARDRRDERGGEIAAGGRDRRHRADRSRATKYGLTAGS